jgi:hypothetical protein
MPHARPQPAAELEAFCPTCPAAQDVTAMLARLGFRLEFQMDEQRDHSGQLPPLPAQYHYKDDAHSTEVIYLAGRDFPMNEDGHTLPPHASRFWLYVGADVQAFHVAMSTLALSYHFTWRGSSEDAAPEQEEVA